MAETSLARQTVLQRARRIKPLREGHRDTGLQRSIGLFQLTMLGVGCTVGTGIFFVLTTNVRHAGPAIIVSFILAAIVAGLTALC